MSTRQIIRVECDYQLGKHYKCSSYVQAATKANALSLAAERDWYHEPGVDLCSNHAKLEGVHSEPDASQEVP